MSEWYYSRAGQQVGPVTSAQLRQAMLTGELTPADLVWKDGMPAWAPAGRIDGLFPPAPAASSAAMATPVAPEAPPLHYAAGSEQPPAAIAYYNPTAGLSQRVATNLKGFPPPTGPQTDWPLSDAQVAQFVAAEKLRKAIRGFNSLCQLASLVCALASLGGLIGVLAASPRRAGAGPFMVGYGVGLLMYVGLALLYYMAGRAALKCRLWGPITVVALFSIGILGTLAMVVVGFVGVSTRGPGSGDAAALIVAMAFIVVIGGILLLVAVRGLLAVPKFLACPVWAQEILVAAKL